MIDARALSLMKPTAFIVNTSRGPVIDIPALVAAVQAGQLAGAGIDVLPVEPCPVDDPVLHEPRIIVTPAPGRVVGRSGAGCAYPRGRGGIAGAEWQSAEISSQQSGRAIRDLASGLRSIESG